MAEEEKKERGVVGRKRAIREGGGRVGLRMREVFGKGDRDGGWADREIMRERGRCSFGRAAGASTTGKALLSVFERERERECVCVCA